MYGNDDNAKKIEGAKKFVLILKMSKITFFFYLHLENLFFDDGAYCEVALRAPNDLHSFQSNELR